MVSVKIVFISFFSQFINWKISKIKVIIYYMKILCLCLSATIQRTLCFESFEKGIVNRTSVFREDASGKALNAARVLNQFESGSAKVLCPVGKENAGRFLDLAARDKIDVSYVSVPGNVRECWTILSAGGSTTEVIADERADVSQELSEQIESSLLLQFSSEIEKCDALLFAGSTPKLFRPDINKKICSIAKSAGKIVLADFCGAALRSVLEEKSAVPDFVKINEEELSKSFPGENIAGKINVLSIKYGNSFIITRGEEKTIASLRGKDFECETEKIVPVNTTACGDSFDAGFLYEMLLSGDFEKALRRGTFAASRNAESVVPGKMEFAAFDASIYLNGSKYR